MQQRPPGIVLSAIALGLVALFLLLLSFGGIVTILGGSYLPADSGAASLPPAALTAFMFGFILVYLGLAGWAVATLVGLVRLRPWARISAMVIAGGLAGLGLLSAFSMMVMQSAFASGSIPIPPNVPPALFHKIILVMTVASFLVAALSVGWLVYLAQRRTREAFTQAQALAQAQHGFHPPFAHPQSAQPSPYPLPTSPAWPAARSVPAPDPLTDFTVARPIIAPMSAAPFSDPQTAPEQPIPPPVLYGDAGQPAPYPGQQAWPAHSSMPAASVRSTRPVSITVLSIFALVGAFFSLFEVVSPLPIFVLGMVLSGWPVHVYGVVWAAALAIAGLGMLRLQRPAWLLSFVLLGVVALNFLVLLLPAARVHYVTYMQQLQRQSSMGLPQRSLPPGMVAISIAIGMFFGLAVIVLAGVLLWRARWAFPAQPPPSPASTEESL